MLDLLYAQAARWRRRSAERHPERQHRLARPVISVGNLSVGGSGKTPVVAAIAQWLVECGERPAILSRGYARRKPVDGVVVVSAGRGPCAGLDESGDEPLMLARAVPAAIVCVSTERHLAGMLAERALGATVHVLDDGFQHLALARDLDVLVTAPGEIGQGRVLPFGRLREASDAASRADVVVVMGATADEARAEAAALGIRWSCAATRAIGSPAVAFGDGGHAPATFGDGGHAPAAFGDSEEAVAARGDGDQAVVSRTAPVLAVTGTANPDRFVADLRAAGWHVARHLAFPDHHVFTRADVVRMARALAESGAQMVFTTDKDAVRVEALGPLSFPVYRVPMSLVFDPTEALFERVRCMLTAARRVGTPSSAEPVP